MQGDKWTRIVTGKCEDVREETMLVILIGHMVRTTKILFVDIVENPTKVSYFIGIIGYIPLKYCNFRYISLILHVTDSCEPHI